MARYEEELKEIERRGAGRSKARVRRRSAGPIASTLAEVCLDAAIVIASLTLLTKRREFWQLGILMGVGRRG